VVPRPRRLRPGPGLVGVRRRRRDRDPQQLRRRHVRSRPSSLLAPPGAGR
jgi:hypothetical protein